MDVIPNHSLIEIIIAIAALLFAFAEAIIKFHGTLSDKNAELYVQFQYIWQHLLLGVDSIGRMLESTNPANSGTINLSNEEIVAYAKTHMISEAFFETCCQFQKSAIICLKDSAKVTIAFDFCGEAESIAKNVNTFYEYLLTYGSEQHRSEEIQRMTDRHGILQFSLCKLKDPELTPDKLREGKESEIENSMLAKIIKECAQRQQQYNSFFRGVYAATLILLAMCCVAHIMYLHVQLNHIPWN